MIDWNHVHYAVVFTETLFGSVLAFFWPFYIRRHFKKNWPKYKKMLESVTFEPLMKDVKPHYLRQWCEECDPIPEKKDGEILFCKCGNRLVPRTKTVPKRSESVTWPHSPVITGYDTILDGWYCEICRSQWNDETIRKRQTKFARSLAGDTDIIGPGYNPSGTIPDALNWVSYKFHPGPSSYIPSSPLRFGIYPPDEGYGDS